MISNMGSLLRFILMILKIKKLCLVVLRFVYDCKWVLYGGKYRMFIKLLNGMWFSLLRLIFLW